jgi:molybdopterin molybdotransferase
VGALNAKAPRPEPVPFDDALAALLRHAVAVDGTQEVPTMEAAWRVLAQPLVSPLAVPAWDNSQMDGYAVRCGDLAAAGSRSGQGPEQAPALRVSQRIAAGQQGLALDPGTVARIFTGAAIPAGADAVVMQEQATPAGEDPEGKPLVRFSHLPAPGEWIRRRGEDIEAGATILLPGTRLTPQATGLAASVGAARLMVYRPVRVACFFTGDELAMPGEPLKPGAIYNSNRFLLSGLLRRLGCDVMDLGIIGDSLEATRVALREAALQADLIVTSGGMSVGEEDHVKPAVEAEGELQMWQIAIKPGKPLAYGRVRRPGSEARAAPAAAANQAAGGQQPGSAHFIGLPGNPVSSFVTFLMFVRPFILGLQGVAQVAPLRLRLTAGFDWPRPDRRREFLRVRVDPQTGSLQLFPNQGSAVLTSTVAGDGLLDNPGGQQIRRGDVVTYLPFSDLLN